MMQIPSSFEEITAQWLTEALRYAKIINKTEVTTLQVNPLGVEQGFVGSLFRIELGYSNKEADAPQTLIAKLAPTNLELREAFKTANLREINFYKDLAAGQSLPLPDYYYADIDMETGESVLLIQDLSAIRPVDFVDGCNIDDAKLVVKALAKVHTKWWDSSDLENLIWLLSFNEIPFQEWWTQYPAAITAILPDQKIPDATIKMGQYVSSNLSAIIERLEGHPLTLIHRDVHVDNFLFRESEAVIVDWQMMGRGLGISDVAYFVAGSLNTQERRQAEQDLVHLYHNTLLEAGIHNYSFEQCWSDYQFSVVARFVFSVGAAVLLDNTSDHRQAWRRVDLQRLAAFIEDHKPYEQV